MKRKSSKITTVIFDLGNVIIDFDHTRAYRKFLKYSPFTVKEMHSRIAGSSFVRAYERGSISDTVFFNRFKKRLKLKITRQEFEKIWSDIFFKNQEMEDFVRGIKSLGYRVAILSDTNPLHDKREVSKYPIREISDVYFTSFKLKARKAEGVKIFKIVLKKLKAKPEEVIFIDDRLKNILYARKAGIRSIQFKGISGLKRDLKRIGLPGQRY